MTKVRKQLGNARGDHATAASSTRELTHKQVRSTYVPLSMSATDSGFAHYFTLQGLPNYTDFTNLYDRYTIDKVELVFILVNVPEAAAVANAFYPTLYFAFDPDDATVPASSTELLDRANLQILQFSPSQRSITRVIQPRLATAVYRGVATAGYAVAPPGTFVDMSSPDVQFFGAKMWVANYNSTSTPNARINVYHRVHFRVRGSR